MIKIIDSVAELDKLKGELIGSGREAICYKIPNTFEVIKIYNVDERPKKLLFMDYSSKYIAFPKDIYKDKNGNIIAHTMNYIEGEKCEFGFPESMDIITLKEAFQILVEEISKFPNIYMSDLCLDNIVYNSYDKRFYIIDTTLWKQWNDSLGLNISRLNQNLAHALYQNISWLKEYNFWKENSEFRYQFIQSKNEGFLYFIGFLNQAIQEISNYFGKDITTIQDLNFTHKIK